MSLFNLGRRVWLAAVLAAGSILTLGLPAAEADLLPGGAGQFVVLSQFSNNQTNFNNGTLTGDIGIGSPHQFTISNASLNGSIRFSGAASISGLSGGPVPGSGP